MRIANEEVKGSLVVFVVNPEEKLNFELKMLENYLYDKYEINVKFDKGKKERNFFSKDLDHQKVLYILFQGHNLKFLFYV